jgi:acyl-CoA hydrolase
VADALARKRRSASEAAALVRNGDTLAIPLAPAQPSAFLHALGDRDDLSTLTIVISLATERFPILDRPGVRLLSGFWGHVERQLAAEGRNVQFVPGDFRRYGRIIRWRNPRVIATLASPPDRDGRMSLALHAGGTVDEIHRCGADPMRLLVVEVNPNLPRTLGLPPDHPHCITLDEADVVIESERPLWQIPESEASAVEHAIAEHVRRFVPDGATLQTGIGAMPNEVAKLLASGPGGDYGIHSEMFTSGLMHLFEAGKVSNRKGQHEGYAVCTFAGGTSALYDWLEENPRVRFLPVDFVNEPGIIARNRRMISINGAISVDLAGQVTADTVPGRQHSGAGGHEDFVNGASMSAGGHSLVCLPSTARANGRTVSRVAASLAAGGIVTTPRHQVDVIVTEYGAAELAGRSVAERAAALAEIAHPDFRDELREEAKRIARRSAAADR